MRSTGLIVGLMAGLAGLAIGGYFIVRNVFIGSSVTGAGSGISISSSCSGSLQGVGEGTATFSFDGRVEETDTQDACPTTDSIGGHPELSYSGPAGCLGRFFSGAGGGADETGLVDWFRYSARDAYIVSGNQVYHFIHGPHLRGGLLLFSQSFPDHQISVTVSCPPPPRSSGPLLPPSY